ncbi:hypothetical protein N783_11185 [Pontibacillus marinus BH030004 = DSM 16465]|uniref:Uncharacterized protein n=1 Tax=Pontibacillus marinus BH030004 = DSM 16465 TaxID=1385511 RepID=A0A0A5GJE1_9BACI|nr:hypothetical protein N783_11185 [Pontibacillus marinus BH030004 = DSM 16465]
MFDKKYYLYIDTPLVKKDVPFIRVVGGTK